MNSTVEHYSRDTELIAPKLQQKYYSLSRCFDAMAESEHLYLSLSLQEEYTSPCPTGLSEVMGTVCVCVCLRALSGCEP